MTGGTGHERQLAPVKGNVVAILDELPPERWRVLLTAEGFGLLRKDLVSVLGMNGARNFLTRFGWNCGFQDATTIRSMFPNIDPLDWYSCGARLHSRSGIVQVRMDVSWYDPGSQTCYFDGEWIDSLEAEQHMQLFGRSDEVVCWTLAGYASGYKSGVLGRDVLCIEVECKGRGDSRCRFVGKPVSEWGGEVQAELEYYKPLHLVEELYQLYRKLDDTGWLKEAFELQRAINRLLADGAGVDAVVAQVSRYLGAEIGVVGRDLDLLYYEGPANSAARRTRIRECRSLLGDPRRIGPYTERLGQDDLYALVCPVRGGSDLRGWLVLFRGSPFREAEVAICEHAASICYVMWGQSAKLTQEELVERLFAGADRLQWEEKALRLGLNEARRYAAGVVEGRDPGRALQDLGNLLGGSLEWKSVKSEACYFVLTEAQVAGMREVRHELERLCKEKRLYVSLGSVAPPKLLPDSVDQARRTRAVLSVFAPEGGLLFYDEIRSYELISQGGGAVEQMASLLLTPVVAYDQQKQSDLLRTLEAYLSTESVSQTSKLCNLHPSGVKYRLRKVERLLGVSLRDRRVRFELQFALLVRRLTNTT